MAAALPFYGTGVNPFAGAPPPVTDGPLPTRPVTWGANTILTTAALYTYQIATVTAAGVVITLPSATGLPNGAWFAIRPSGFDITLSTGATLTQGTPRSWCRPTPGFNCRPPSREDGA